VLLPLPLTGAFDYLCPAPLSDLAPGDFVEVPFGRKTLTGVVWGHARGDVDPAKLKPILAKLEIPPLPAPQRRFTDWVAAYTMSPPGAILKMALGGQAWKPFKRKPKGAGTPASNPAAPPTLSPEQAAAAAALTQKVTQGGASVTLLDGVTGSGKTEVYCEAIAACLAKGQQALVLLPEIALTTQILDRFTARFGTAPALWHSDVSDSTRRHSWLGIATGTTPLVVGARSALFLPYQNLGLIIVDEEHESAFKQEDGVFYHGRDMAVARGHIGQIPVVLASATPSLETLANVESGRYDRLVLPQRHGGAVLPDVTLIDLCAHPPERQSWLSPPLVSALTQTFADQGQAMLFLNRRGYAPLTLCRACGHRFQCPNCSAWLVAHQGPPRLKCHHCDYSNPLPKHCPACQAEGQFFACGPGVERIAEEATRRFPNARIAVMTSDTIEDSAAASRLIAAMEAGEIDLLVGTQIMAKGHNFPNLVLVGVVDADLGLAGGDLRAAERTFQLLQQVAGRSGRSTRRGRVFLQTLQPTHPVMQALAIGDRDGFLRAEAAERRLYAMPPFGRLAAIILSSPDAAILGHVGEALAKAVPATPDIRVLGPADAPLALLRGRHRRRFLIKAGKTVRLQNFIQTWLGSVRFPRSVRVQIDIDPYSFF
jgi:primosomal protein N' (replication factor Y) (superfamily II helicase)